MQDIIKFENIFSRALRDGDLYLIKEIIRHLKDNKPTLIKLSQKNKIFYNIWNANNTRLRRELSNEKYYAVRRYVRELLKILESGIKVSEEDKEKLNTKNNLDRISNLKLKKTSKMVLFYGAGASRAAPSNIPTVSELLDEMWKKARKLETRPLEKLENWCKKYEVSNIEDVLTALTIANMVINRNQTHNILNSILYESSDSFPNDKDIRDIDKVRMLESVTNNFFSLLVGTMLEAEPNAIHKKTAEIVQKFSNVHIVTTNYDACLEQSLDECNVEYSYLIGEEKNKSTELIKMHGSINWYYCEICQHIMMPAIESMKRKSETNLERIVPYPLLAMCPKCNGTAKQFIVPPTSQKYILYPPIVKVWDACRKAIDISSIILIVGYSFGDADDYIVKMLMKTLSENTNKIVIVCDNNEEVLSRFKDLLFRHAENFPTENFIPLKGKGEELFVKALDNLNISKAAVKKKTAKSKSIKKKTASKKKIVK